MIQPPKILSAILAELRRLGFGSAIEEREGEVILILLDGGEVSLTAFARSLAREL